MSMNKIDTRIEGTSFSRLWCEACKAETQHYRMKCSCGATHKAYPVRSVFTRGIGVTPNSKRRGRFSINGYPLMLEGSRPPKVEVK